MKAPTYPRHQASAPRAQEGFRRVCRRRATWLAFIRKVLQRVVVPDGLPSQDDAPDRIAPMGLCYGGSPRDAQRGVTRGALVVSNNLSIPVLLVYLCAPAPPSICKICARLDVQYEDFCRRTAPT
jgi:hypothetical protein